jgi:GT2 family glycosyltransferase
MTESTVSVLMTVYNTEAYIREAIESILAQSLGNFELIVVDDASTDSSWAIVAEAAARDPRIVAVRRDERGGASSGLNDALARAGGRYITRQDADDAARPERLARQVEFLERNPGFVGVGTAAVMVDAKGRAFGQFVGPQHDAEIQEALLDRMCFCGPTVMARRSALEAMRFRFDESLSSSEDYDFCLRIAEAGRLANLPEHLYLYRQHAGSVSHSRRYPQLVRKAAALEQALYRRYGAQPPAARLSIVARDYLRAAIVGHATRQTEGVPECVAKAISLDAALLGNAALVKAIVGKYSPAPIEDALAFVASLFADVLPQTRRLRRVRRQLAADLHMRQVFAAPTGAAGTPRHLWSALASDPAWLRNRGVLALMLRQVVGRYRFGNAHPAARL